MLRKLRENKGFTMIELLMVIICLTVLVQMAWNFLGDMRRRSYDVTAVADGRNLFTVVRGNFINLDDVSYEHAPGDGPDIGTKDTSNNPRPAIFTLSSGVRARIAANTRSGVPEDGYFDAVLFHEAGTDDPTTLSGRKEYWYFAEEATETYSLPTF
jgi:prepilin-type N-terminal cleavage/methylation domain-containing protein